MDFFSKLGSKITDTTDPDIAAESINLVIKPAAELSIGYTVRTLVYTSICIHDRHAAEFGTQMRMVISSVKKVTDAVIFASYAKKSTHKKNIAFVSAEHLSAICMFLA